MTDVQLGRTSRLELRARIVEATARLLREHGPAAVTTRGVADAAGVQAPAIYRLFGDKDGLLDAVAEHQFAHYVDDKARADETDDPVADLHTAWDRHIRFGLANASLFAVLVDPARSASPTAAAGLEILRARVRRIAAAGRLRVPEGRAVALIHAAGTGAILTLLAEADGTRDPSLADSLFDAVLHAVLIEPAGKATSGPSVTTASTAAITLRAGVDDLTTLSSGERALLAEWLDRIAADG